MRLFTDRIHSFTEERHAPLLIHFIQHQHRRRYNLVNRQRHAHRTPATSIITFITQNKCEITITIYIYIYHNKININIQMWCRDRAMQSVWNANDGVEKLFGRDANCLLRARRQYIYVYGKNHFWWDNLWTQLSRFCMYHRSHQFPTLLGHIYYVLCTSYILIWLGKVSKKMFTLCSVMQTIDW